MDTVAMVIVQDSYPYSNDSTRTTRTGTNVLGGIMGATYDNSREAEDGNGDNPGHAYACLESWADV